MSSVSAKSAVGRQSQLPFRRAFKISLNSVKIRIGRSVITAGGIFLGIAFFAVVLTQSLMQWPVAGRIDAGFVNIDGQVKAPNDYEAWKLIPVGDGIQSGIPKEVVDRVAQGGTEFSLTRIVKGQLDYQKDQKMLKQLRSEWSALKKIQKPVAFYVDAAQGNDVKVSDAIKYGVPRKIIKSVAGNKATVNGTDIADAVRESSEGMNSFYAAVLLDQDITINDAVEAGIPETIAKTLAAEGRIFKAGPLNDAIIAQPDAIKLWEGREKMNSIYMKADKSAIKELGNKYALTLNDIIANSKGFADGARKAQVMIVNKDRQISVDFEKDGDKAGSIKLIAGDQVFVPDMDSYYRMLWLVIMSLLVCFVGITNSMLMAVTERFKEIGTMKCLGALDSFVVLLFMLESGMMGVIASALGWFVGSGAIILLAGFTKGWGVVGSIQPIQILGTFALSVVVGLVLTIIATVPPAMRAASMPAAMALRSEI